jgi:hypothetical protein
MLLFCVNCGSPYESPDKFCNSCGKPLPMPKSEIPQDTFVQTEPSLIAPTAIIMESTLPEEPAGAVAAAQEESPRRPIPYARFTLFAVLATVCCSTLGFVVLDDAYRRKFYLVPFAILMSIALALCIRKARMSWIDIGTYGDCHNLVHRLRKKLIHRLGIFSALSLGGGMLLGAQVGQSGAETEAYVSDLAIYADIGQRISEARNGAEPNIEAQLAMYQEIDLDVLALQSIAARLKRENQEYAEKYPAAHATTTDSAEAFEKTSKRSELLLQQIAIARQISNAQGHDAQVAIYRVKMMPILAEEDQLDVH